MQEAAAALKRSDEARIQADVMRASDATTAPMAVDRDGCN